jgi:hypothetical protein
MATKISQLPAASTPLTGAELVPLVQSGKTVQVPVNQILAIDSVSIMSYVPFGTNISTTDCAPYVQLAVNYAIANNLQVNVDGMFLLSTMVNIDRHVDYAIYADYFKFFTTVGGGFKVTTNMAMFSSTLPFTTDPVSQLIRWNGITFKGNAGASYVLNGGRFLRMVFDGCDFEKILCCNCSIYAQSISFIGRCNARYGVGTFWRTATVSIDCTFDVLAESWTGDFLNLAFPISSKVTGVIENISGTAIVYDGAYGFTISAYFEANGLDIDGTGAQQAYGVNLLGGYYNHVNPAQYSVIWGSVTQSCSSIGNFHTGSFHNVPAGADVLIRDSAVVSVQNNSTNPIFQNQALTGGLGLSVIGNGGLVAKGNQWSVDTIANQVRQYSSGADVATNGSFVFHSVRSDGTNDLQVLVITSTGAVTVLAGFGCNGKAAQAAYASGGALAAYGAGANGFDTADHASALYAEVVAIRAALVANGIMS